MSDLTEYVRSRAAQDPKFAEHFEEGYEDLKMDTLEELKKNSTEPETLHQD